MLRLVASFLGFSIIIENEVGIVDLEHNLKSEIKKLMLHNPASCYFIEVQKDTKSYSILTSENIAEGEIFVFVNDPKNGWAGLSVPSYVVNNW